MKHESLDLSRMTVDDLFQAGEERRDRLTDLPFEQKIEIVKRLYPLTQVGFGTLVADLLTPICLDLAIRIPRVSGIPYDASDHLRYDINQHVVSIKRGLAGRQESIEGWQESGFKNPLLLGSELRQAIDTLRTDSDELPQHESSEAETLRHKLPISFLRFEARNGVWIAEWFVDPVTQKNDRVLFDIQFNPAIPTNIKKRLQIEVQNKALSQDSTKNLSIIQPHILA